VTATQPREIVAGRLIRLREKRIEDAEHDYAWRADPELAMYDAARPITMTFRSFVAGMTDDISYPTRHRRSYAMETLEDGRHIGNVMYYGYDSARAEAELGITIGVRDYWGRGCGSEATRLILCHLFDELRLERVYLHTLTWNYRAQESFQKAGFRRVRAVHRMGHDFVLMEALRADHLAEHAAG